MLFGIQNMTDLPTTKGATNFSIAAIMANGGGAPSSRESSERSLSPISVEHYQEVDVEVDVEQCSDSEETSRTPRTKSRKTSTQTPSDDERLTPEPASSRPTIVGSCNCDDLRAVQCHLETKELWDKFHDVGTEMIVTKVGRRMFPTLRVSFSGPLRQTQPSDRYVVLLDVVATDSRRYRYAYHRSSWLVAGKADPPAPSRLYVHPDTPLGPDALRKQVISFEKVKLTNNEMDKNGQIVLNSMHRYQPRIHLVRLKHGQNIPTTCKQLQELDHKTYVFHETVFTAVTAYQNQLITKLKIDSNPFAKGFRDSSRLTDFDRDPMEALMLEQHMRSPFGIFPDPIMAQLMQQDADNASAAFLEKARQHLQMFGRTPYTDLLMPQVYQRQNFGGFNLSLWPPQIASGFMNNNSAAAPRTTPSPASTSISSGSPPLDMRAKHFQRFSPYQIPQQNHSPKPDTPP